LIERTEAMSVAAARIDILDEASQEVIFGERGCRAVHLVSDAVE